MRIGICGTQCSGKTTLAKYIAEHDNLTTILDVAGQFKDRSTSNAQIKIAFAQMKIECDIGDNFVSDRTIFDNIAYQNYLDPFLPIVGMGASWDIHMQHNPYDLVVFIGEYFPLEDSPHREMDEKQQLSVYDYLKTYLPRFTRAYHIPMVTVFGTTEHRYDMIEDFLHTQHRYIYGRN